MPAGSTFTVTNGEDEMLAYLVDEATIITPHGTYTENPLKESFAAIHLRIIFEGCHGSHWMAGCSDSEELKEWLRGLGASLVWGGYPRELPDGRPRGLAVAAGIKHQTDATWESMHTQACVVTAGAEHDPYQCRHDCGGMYRQHTQWFNHECTLHDTATLMRTIAETRRRQLEQEDQQEGI